MAGCDQQFMELNSSFVCNPFDVMGMAFRQILYAWCPIIYMSNIHNGLSYVTNTSVMDMMQVDWTNLSEPTEGWFHTCECKLPWWHYQMETFSMLLAFCAGKSPVNSLLKCQWQGALMFSMICTWTNSWTNNRDAGDLRCHCAHYDIVMHRCSYRCSATWWHQMLSFLSSGTLVEYISWFIDMTDILKMGS